MPPRLAFEVDNQAHALSVLPTLVYGDPPQARVDVDEQLVHLQGDAHRHRRGLGADRRRPTSIRPKPASMSMSNSFTCKAKLPYAICPLSEGSLSAFATSSTWCLGAASTSTVRRPIGLRRSYVIFNEASAERRNPGLSARPCSNHTWSSMTMCSTWNSD